MAVDVRAAPTPPLPPQKMTYEEFLQWPGENQHVEWVNGEVVEMPPISGDHQEEGSFLLTLFRIFVEEKQAGILRYEPFQMKTGPGLSGRAPDLLFVANENLSRLKPTFLEGPADLVIEIISPDDPNRDRVEKFKEYQEGGVREYWLIDNLHQQADFYLLDANGLFQSVPVGTDGIYRSAVLPDLWIKVEWLWQRPPILHVLQEWGLV